MIPLRPLVIYKDDGAWWVVCRCCCASTSTARWREAVQIGNRHLSKVFGFK